MKTRRRSGCVALLLLAGLVSAPQAAAQQRGPMGDPAAMVDDHMEALTEAVGLSDEQVALIRPIYEGQAAKLSEMMAGARGQGRSAMEAMRPQLEALRDETHSEVRANLTEEQIEPYEDFVKAQQKERQSRMRGGPPSGR